MEGGTELSTDTTYNPPVEYHSRAPRRVIMLGIGKDHISKLPHCSLCYGKK